MNRPMFDPSAEPEWMRRVSTLALRLGFRRALAALSGAMVLMVLTLAGLAFVGLGQHPMAMLAAGALALLLAPLFSLWLLRLVFQLDAARQHQTSTATRDDLTGVHNRRHFMQVAEREWARCRRYSEDGALLLIDADHFKALSESHGRACCDALLRDITRAVTQSLRLPDLLARYDGKALIVYLPNTDPLGALDVAERIRERVAGHTLRWQDVGISTTVSVGVASVGATHLTLDALVLDASAALRVAKEAGYNCVRAAPIQPRALPTKPPSQASGLRGRRR
jgi:diguanylate cyclase